MSFFEDMRDAMGRLAVFEELHVDTEALPGSVVGLSDRSVRDALLETAGAIKQLTMLQTLLAGVAAQRSARERGHGGFTQETGHRTAVEFIRDVTGATRGEAIRTVKVGESLLEGVPVAGAPAVETADLPVGSAVARPVPRPWHQPLTNALLAGVITAAQHDAIRRGLGAPPVAATADASTDDAVDAWRAAADQLVGEAEGCTVEDLRARARTVRDLADPEGAAARYAHSIERRSYRGWMDEDGMRHGRIVYDPEMGASLDHLFATALSPRRGGPRFVAEDERRAAEELTRDARTNEQLAYDLLMDLICAGAKARHEDVFGVKEAGLRLIALRDSVTGAHARRDAFGRLVGAACTEDGLVVLPGPVLEKTLCTTGTIELITDTVGNPLDLGREARLYDKRQRVAIAARDGGCVWPGCDRPPHLCEVHHIDEWAGGGATDCDRGILLCRYHHLHLHNNGWRITRGGKDPFQLHTPPHVPARSGSAPIRLQSKSPLRWLWDPPDRAGWRHAA